jgi:hypothetical protein
VVEINLLNLGHAVVKVPYSNAGQGVYTITNKEELTKFMDTNHFYDKFIVQSLVGNASWSSITKSGKFYHVGTVSFLNLNLDSKQEEPHVCS